MVISPTQPRSFVGKVMGNKSHLILLCALIVLHVIVVLHVVHFIGQSHASVILCYSTSIILEQHNWHMYT